MSPHLGPNVYCKAFEIKWIIILVAVCAGSIANAQGIEIERYRHLQSSAMFDPNTSDAYVNQLLQDGVNSQDPVIFRLVLQSINTYVDHQLEGRIEPAGSLRNRSINRIPGLKQALIEHWRREHARHGHNASKFVLDELRSQASRDIVSTALADQEVESNQSGEIISEILEQWLGAQHPWLEIPHSLCVLWPQDDAVHTLLWEFFQNDDSIEPRDVLRLLNLGKFVTPAANRFRIAQLVAYPTGAPPDAEHAISLAARGLAMSHPEEAIANLVRAGYDHIEPRREILITLAGYEDSQLNPFHYKIWNLILVTSPSGPLDERYLNARDRLDVYVNRPFYDRWLSSLRGFFD